MCRRFSLVGAKQRLHIEAVDNEIESIRMSADQRSFSVQMVHHGPSTLRLRGSVGTVVVDGAVMNLMNASWSRANVKTKDVSIRLEKKEDV